MHYCSTEVLPQKRRADTGYPTIGAQKDAGASVLAPIDGYASGDGPHRTFDSSLASMSTAQLHRFRAEVVVRVPRNGEGDLVSEATRRLEASGVEQLTVTALCGLEPGLSATLVTLEVRANTTETDSTRVAGVFSSAPGLQRVRTISRER